MDSFAALADPTRRKIIELVAAGSRTAGEIADEFPVSRPAISQHLSTLTASGILAVHPAGRRRVYSLDASGLDAALEWIGAQHRRGGRAPEPHRAAASRRARA